MPYHTMPCHAICLFIRASCAHALLFIQHWFSSHLGHQNHLSLPPTIYHTPLLYPISSKSTSAQCFIVLHFLSLHAVSVGEEGGTSEFSAPISSLRGRKGWGDKSVSHVLAAIDERRTLSFSRWGRVRRGVQYRGEERGVVLCCVVYRVSCVAL